MTTYPLAKIGIQNFPIAPPPPPPRHIHLYLSAAPPSPSPSPPSSTRPLALPLHSSTPSSSSYLTVALAQTLATHHPGQFLSRPSTSTWSSQVFKPAIHLAVQLIVKVGFLFTKHAVKVR